MTQDEQKKAAALKALDFVEDGMHLGLGTGSTAAMFVDLLGERVKQGLHVLCVPTSEATHEQARKLGIPLATLEELPHLHLTIDGADELDDHLHLIKGGGGALLREKIVATASDRMAVIADASKHVDVLGRFPLPIEVERFGLQATINLVMDRAKEAGCDGKIALRKNRFNDPFVTDGGNYILDCHFYPIKDPEGLGASLCKVAGMVEHGLFLGIATTAIVAGPDGVRLIEAQAG